VSDSFPSWSWSNLLPWRTTPTMPLLGLSVEEATLIKTLQAQASTCRSAAELSEAFYLGAMVIQNLRIAIPKELEFINPIVGWGAKAVDPYVERLHADGFRLSGATEVDPRISEILDGNGFAADQRLAYTDALSMGRGYWCVGSPLERGDVPLVTVESPLNMSVLWDLRGVSARAAMQEFWADGRRHGTLMVPGKTVTVAENDKGEWEVVDRDKHGFDFVPVVRMANRPRTHDRDGRSEINPALRYYIANACRTLLGLEVARELYSVPQKILLGATEADFQNSDGTPKSAWETYITRVLALERDDEGNLPELKQSQPYDPATFTKILDWLASAAASEVASPPQDMGLYTQGNPATAEAVEASNAQRDAHARAMQPQFAESLKQVAKYALRFTNGGRLPDEFRRLEVDWSPVSEASPGIISDAISKQVAAEAIPATSDVTLKRLGYSVVERAQLEQDRKREDGRQAAKAIAAALTPPIDPNAASDDQPAGQ
jgi:hypothetical protein